MVTYSLNSDRVSETSRRALATVSGYLDRFDYSDMEPSHFPANIYGLGRFAVRSMLISTEQRVGQGFVDHTPDLDSELSDRIFERFFYDLYNRCEIALNEDLRSGIRSGIRIDGDTAVALGRQKYSSARGSTLDLVSFPKTSKPVTSRLSAAARTRKH
jgi:hypothetical protein